MIIFAEFLESMSVFDIIVLVCLLVALCIGLKKG